MFSFKKVIRLGILISIFSLHPLFGASSLFEEYNIKFQGKFDSYHVEDLDQDGLKDILLFLKRGDAEEPKERWLSVYLQKQDGFASEPLQSFQLSEDVILLDIGDVADDSKKELVYFARDGIFYLSFTATGFDLTPHKLFDTQSIFMLSDRQSMRVWNFVADVNGDGIDDVFVPLITKAEIYFRNPADGAGWTKNEIPLRMEPTIYAFYSQRYSVGNKTSARYATPYILFQDFNSDGRKDLFSVYEDSLVVFCQNTDGSFQKTCHHNIALNFGEIWHGAKIQRTHLGDKSERNFLMRIIDLNHDGLVDIVATHVSTEQSFINPETDVRVYFGRRDTSANNHNIYFNENPDQILQPNGTQMVLDIIDFNHDQKYDFIMPMVEVGLKNIIKMLLTKRAEVQAEVFLSGTDGLYPKEPDAQARLVVPFTFKGGPISPVYEIADFNGDGYYDILSSLEETKLILFFGDEKDIIHSSIDEKYNVVLPQDGEHVMAQDLNADGKSDVIITYSEDEAEFKNLENIIKVLFAK